MARGRRSADLTTLQMALVGYQIERQRIEEKIQELQKQLRGTRGIALAGGVQQKRVGVKRVLSPEARKRIAAAQRKRWAEHRKRMAGEKGD